MSDSLPVVPPDLGRGAPTQPATRVAPRRRERWRGQWRVLLAISCGGALGAVVRFALGSAFPARPNGFPWSTFAINVSGCLLIGVLLVFITEAWTPGPLVRPFLGIGVLGGYTTFSTYVVEFERLVADSAARTALAYLAGTLIAAMFAVSLGAGATRRVLRLRPRLENR